MINSVIALMGRNYDADAQLYFNQLTVQPSTAFKVAINTLVLTLKADGNWPLLDRMWIHATEIQQHARVSLVNPSSTQITEVNSPTWAANNGYTGNGSSTFLDTNTPQNSTTNYTQNSACFGAYCLLNQAQIGIVIGVSNAGGNSYMYPRYSDGRFYVTANGGPELNVSMSDSRGLTVGVRPDAANRSGYKNGIQVVAGAAASVPRSAVDWSVLCYNQTLNFSTQKVALSLIGSGAINQLALYNSIQTFATTRGFNV